MPSSFADVSWLFESSKWLTSPSIIPWIGMIAAIVAVLTIRPRDWLTCPKTLVVRSVQATAVWLLFVFLLGMMSGTLGYDKGSGKGTNGDKDELKEDEDGGETETPLITVKSIPATNSVAGFDLTIRFIPSEANTFFAQEFTCDLIIAAGEDIATQVTIRAEDMENFEMLLVKELRAFKAAQDKPSLQVLVQNAPSPGRSVLRNVVDKIRDVLEDCDVSVGGPE